MAYRIKFFRDRVQAQETLQFLNVRRIRSFIRERGGPTVLSGEEPYGFDVFVLRNEDLNKARELLEYEYGNQWGEAVKEEESS